MQNKRSYFLTSRRLSPHPIHTEMKTPGKKKEKRANKPRKKHKFKSTHQQNRPRKKKQKQQHQ